jgi:hypothetical protein
MGSHHSISRKNRVNTHKTPLLTAIALLLALPAAAVAETKPTDTAPKPTKTLLSIEELNQRHALIKQGKYRAVASTSTVPTEAAMSEKYKILRDELVKEQTAEGLAKLLDRMEAEYKDYPTDLKFVAALLLPLRVYKGFVPRTLVVANKATIVRERALAGIRTLAEFIDIQVPDSQWEGAFRLMTESFGGKMFQTERQVQDFFADKVYAAVEQAIQRITEIGKLETPIVWDNKIRFGGVFMDSPDRFQSIGEPERLAVLAKLHKRAYRIQAASAYDLTDLMAIKREIGKKYGFDSAKSAGADIVFDRLTMGGVTRKEKVAIGESYRKTFGNLLPEGRERMAKAFLHLGNFVSNYRDSWALARQLGDDDYNIIDAEFFGPDHKRTQEAVEQMWAFMQGKTRVTSDVSGAFADVNVPAFFGVGCQGGEACGPVANLLDLEPTKFEEGQEEITVPKDRWVEDVGRIRDVKWRKTYRNYFVGRATGWNPVAYKALFPEVSSPKDVATKFRAVTQARGGRLVTGLVMSFVQ